MKIHPAPATLILGIALMGPGLAEVAVVDDGATLSVHATIQEAVSAAPPNARVVVPGGSYDGFVVDRPVVIKGEAADDGTPVTINGDVVIHGLDGQRPAALSTMCIERVRITGASSCVVLDRLEIFGTSPSLVLTDAGDVRAFRVRTSVSPQPFAPGTWWLRRSRLDATDCQVQTGRAALGVAGTTSILSESSFLHLNDCTVHGGPGGHESLHAAGVLPAGDGASAVVAIGGSGTRITDSALFYGPGGHAAPGAVAGLSAPAFRTIGGLHESWQSWFAGPGGSHFVQHDIQSVVRTLTPLARLAVTGALHPGDRRIDCHAFACFGTSVGLRISGEPVLGSLTGSRIPELCTGGTVKTLLAAPGPNPSGFHHRQLRWTPTISEVVFVQAISYLPGPGREATNGIAFVP